MKKRLQFNNFLHFLYKGNDFHSIVIGKRIFLLKNNKKSIPVSINQINSINIKKKFLFCNIILSTADKNYTLSNFPTIKAIGIKRFLEFCINYGLLREEFSLFDSVTNSSQYVSNSLNMQILDTIKNSVLSKYKNLPFDTEKKKECKKYLKLYKHYRENYESIRQLNNENFLENELENYKEFFDNLESNPLTQMQRLAIITNEDNNLIVAGAGSGKTSVIAGKVFYLLKKKLATPNEILVLAFNKKAQEEIQERLQQKLEIVPEVKTFHGLGNHILNQGQYKKALSKIASDEYAFKNTIKSIIEDNLNDEKFAETMKIYFQEFFYPMPNIANFKEEGEYYNYLENFEVRTLNGELVRSLEECSIANFLYLNGINYEYERTYPYNCGNYNHGLYKPDFYLPDYDIYIEHFAINKEGITPDFIDCKKYCEGIEWKRRTHTFYNTKLIETYSWENFEGNLLNNLKTKLLKCNVQFKSINKENMFNKLNNSKHIDTFTELTSTFLNHFKSNQFELKHLYEKLSSQPEQSDTDTFKSHQDKRKQAFLNIFETISKQYKQILDKNNENDFNDMILTATQFIENGFFKSSYKYILVDEFQDISQGRALLLKALKKDTGAKLFCVGDDWQSIYRFTGSDISIMTNFEKEFGYTKRIDLDMTFRFDNQINSVATKFITKNSDQLKKQIKTVKKSDEPSVFIYYKDNDEDSVRNILNEIVYSLKGKKSDVLILSRFNKLKDKDAILRQEYKTRLENYKKEFPQLKIEFSSVHGAKGLGFDYVIVTDMNRGAFPLEKIDDPILNMVLPQEETYPNAEERRLFYVALTRAKEKVYLVCDSKPSSFIEELETGNYNIGIYGNSENSRKMKCPKCSTGLLIKSTSKKSFVCSHSAYCDFITPVCDNCQKGYLKYNEEKGYYECTNPRCHEIKLVCPKCNNGYLIKREGQYGEFWGCSNYPKCNYTKRYKQKDFT